LGWNLEEKRLRAMEKVDKETTGGSKCGRGCGKKPDFGLNLGEMAWGLNRLRKKAFSYPDFSKSNAAGAEVSA
jgi:hypothetical protein